MIKIIFNLFKKMIIYFKINIMLLFLVAFFVGGIFTQYENIVTAQNKSVDLNKDNALNKIEGANSDSNLTLIGQWADDVCLSVDVSGNYAFITSDSSQVYILDISDPIQPKKVSKIILKSNVTKIVVQNSFAYVVTEEEGLFVINVSDPAEPEEMGFFEMNDRYWRDLAVKVPYVYVADGVNGLRIIDVSDPGNPAEIGTFNTEDNAISVALNDSYVYLTDGGDVGIGGGGKGLCLINIDNPSSPTEISSIRSPLGISGSPYNVAVTDSFAYITYMTDFSVDLQILDISNPLHPLELYIKPIVYTFGLTANGNYVYLTPSDYGLILLDVSNPREDPKQVASFFTGGGGGDVVIKESNIYFAAGDKGLYILQNDLIVDVNNNSKSTRNKFYLSQNHPNPFNPKTTISYQIFHGDVVTLKVYNFLGEVVATLLNEYKTAGEYTIIFTGTDFPSGMYIYRLQTKDYSESKKLLLLK